MNLTIISTRCEDRELLDEFEKLRNVNVICKPVVFNEELEEHYRRCNALLFPSKYEGCSNTVIEANCFNLPVICFEDCLGASLAAKNAKLAVGDTPRDFHDAIDMFIREYQYDNFGGDPFVVVSTWNEEIRKLVKNV